MIVDAVIKLVTVAGGSRIDVFSPKYRFGLPIMALNAEYVGRPVKLITSWGDIPSLDTPVCINGSIIPDDQAGKCALSRGMFISTFGSDIIYVVAPERLI